MNSTLAEQMLKVQIADALRWEEARIVASQAPLMHPMLYLPPPGKFKPEECRWMRESRPDLSSDAPWVSPRSDPKTFLLQSWLKLVSFSCSQPLPGCFKRSPLRSATTKTSLTPPGWVHLTTHKKPHPTPFSAG